MIIYGLALLSACTFVGMFLGDILGALTGINSNVGGVGFAMLLLILISDKLIKKNKFPADTQNGIMFWNLMFVPIVVAMTACQNVAALISGGPLVITAGVLAVLVCFAFMPLLTKIGGEDEPLPPLDGKEGQA